MMESAFVVALFLCLLPGETVGNNCSKDVSWKDKTYYRKLRIQGEWIKINCAITASENVTFWFGKSKGEIRKKLKVDKRKIKLVSKNVFNITNLTTEDHGWYTCQVCGKKLAKFLEVADQGKAYAKPIVVKKPNKALYDIEDSVKLTCHAEGITVAAYEIMWYKLNSDEKFEKLRSAGSYVNGMWTETLSLNGLSERDEGTYMCKIHRYPLQYSAKELVNISLEEPLSPKIQIDNELVHFKPEQGKDFLLSYNVSSYPASYIKWWKSKDGIYYELITRCSPSEKCEKHLRKENISKTNFEIKDLKYPEDNFFYKCNAFNKYGNASKTFQVEVYVKPVILLERTHIYEKGMIINCSLTKSVVNPPQVNYTWYSCGTSKCDEKNLKLISELYSLPIESQSNTRMNYRCKANNAAGSAYQDILVVIVSNKPCDDKNASLISILLPIGVISMIILIFLALHIRRKKIMSWFRDKTDH